MKKEDVLNFFDHFPKGLYIQSLEENKMINGYFTDRAALEKALDSEIVNPNAPLYFIGHKLADTTLYPVNTFAKIKVSVKKDNIEKIRYLIIDIDPLNNKRKVNGKSVYRNLTVSENLAIIEEAKTIRDSLIAEGFDNIGIINSGNGSYLLFPLSQKVDETKTLDICYDTLNEFVNILKRRANLKQSHIDQSTLKATQCFKIPGTLSIKGEASAYNPYRYAEIIEEWDINKSCAKQINDYINAHKDEKSKLLISNSKGKDELDIEMCIDKCMELFPVCNAGNHDYYARVERDGKYRDMLLESRDFPRELRLYLRAETGIKAIRYDDIYQIINALTDAAYVQDEVTLFNRSYFDRENNTVYYDLSNYHDVVRITDSSIDIIPKPFGIFVQQLGDLEQVMYEPSSAKELPELLSKIVNLDTDGLIILATYICICFLGNCFPTPILLVTGAQGSSKSTLTRFIQKIIHPNIGGLLSLIGEKKQDLAISLSRRLLICFDNCTNIKPEISDLLCSAVTSGCFQTRELYTTKDECLIKYKSIMVINGIDIVSHRTDLMERCILLELPKIAEDERKSEKEMNQIFDSILPKILGAIFDAIQKALSMQDIQLNNLTRMADYEEFSVKLAQVMGYTSEQYQTALRKNIQSLVDAVSFGNPTIFSVVEIMRGKSYYHDDNFTHFYSSCDTILTEKMTTQEKALFPRSSSAFSRALSGMEKNLKSFGITYEIKNGGPCKQITLWNDGTVIPNVNPSDAIGKIAYDAVVKDLQEQRDLYDEKIKHN